jgi:putative copper export protein
LITASLAVLLLATLAEILVRTQEMSGATLGLSIIVAPNVMARTHIGQILAVRLALVALGLVLWSLRAAGARTLVLFAAVIVAVTLSLAGHAADWGDLTLSVAVDCAHALAASVWIGGLIAMTLAVLRRGASRPREPVAPVDHARLPEPHARRARGPGRVSEDARRRNAARGGAIDGRALRAG